MFNEKFMEVINRSVANDLYCLKVTSTDEYDCVQFKHDYVNVPWSADGMHYEIRRFKDGSYRIGFHVETTKNFACLFNKDEIMPFIAQCLELAIRKERYDYRDPSCINFFDELKFNEQKTKNIEVYWDIPLNQEIAAYDLAYRLSQFAVRMNSAVKNMVDAVKSVADM